MNPFFDQTLAEGYRSRSQKIRILTEAWVHRNLYCPRCGNRPLSQFPNNRAVADFFCPACRNQYELKSKGGPMGEKIADGAYETFLRRITSDSNPDFFILRYHASQLCVEDLWVIPKQFFTPAVVEKRKPLAASARRAGWVGCNILLGDIPRSGQIPMIRGRVPAPRETVLAQMRRSAQLTVDGIDARGWLLDVLRCVERLPEQFTLQDIYRFEGELAERHPENHNIRPKIRQQLQALRDRGILRFREPGHYQRTFPGAGM